MILKFKFLYLSAAHPSVTKNKLHKYNLGKISLLLWLNTRIEQFPNSYLPLFYICSHYTASLLFAMVHLTLLISVWPHIFIWYVNILVLLWNALCLSMPAVHLCPLSKLGSEYMLLDNIRVSRLEAEYCKCGGCVPFSLQTATCWYSKDFYTGIVFVAYFTLILLALYFNYFTHMHISW